LGGISFTKGCYTGQEIVARTHYLGEVKRRLFVARCETELEIAPNCSILDEKGATVGNVLVAQNGLVQCVLHVEAQNSALRLNLPTQDVLTLVGIL